MSDQGSPRRSAGMRGHPLNAAPEHRPISTTPKAKPQAAQPERASASRHPAPKVLMGEVAAPLPKYAASGQPVTAERNAFRAFMLKHRLTPTGWARAAGVPQGEVLAFLAGQARAISDASIEKLAAAANAAPGDLFR